MDNDLTLREQQLLGGPPPITKREFIEKVWSIHPVGNPSDSFVQTCVAIKHNKTFEGGPVTLDLIATKWKEYIDYCKLTGRAQQYTKGLSRWLEAEEWNASYDLSAAKQQLDFFTKPQEDDGDDQSYCGRPEAPWDDQ